MRIIAETTCSKKCKVSVAAILGNFQSFLRQGNHCGNFLWNSQKVLEELGYIFKIVAFFSNCMPDLVK